MNLKRSVKHTTLEPEIFTFAQGIYREHLRRIKAKRLRAATGHFVWPVLGVFLAAVPLVALATFVQFFLGQYPEKVQQIIAVEHHGTIVTAMWALSGFGSFLGFVSGLVHGLSRSRESLFNAERLELKLRSEFYLRNLCSAVLSTEKSES